MHSFVLIITMSYTALFHSEEFPVKNRTLNSKERNKVLKNIFVNFFLTKITSLYHQTSVEDIMIQFFRNNIDEMQTSIGILD